VPNFLDDDDGEEEDFVPKFKPPANLPPPPMQ